MYVCVALEQVWIVLELCTRGTLLDAALEGRLKTSSDGDRITQWRMGMVSVCGTVLTMHGASCLFWVLSACMSC